MTLREFANVFAALAVQLRYTDADEAAIRLNYEPLKDLEIEFVALAATRLARESEWFPKSSEWRAMAAKVEAERREAQRALMRRLPSPLCAGCEDTGWIRDADDRVRKCDCATLRRLELLGRRPWPALPAATSAPAKRTEADRVDNARSLKTAIERRLGVRIAPRGMPGRSRAVRATVADDTEATNG